MINQTDIEHTFSILLYTCENYELRIGTISIENSKQYEKFYINSRAERNDTNCYENQMDERCTETMFECFRLITNETGLNKVNHSQTITTIQHFYP